MIGVVCPSIEESKPPPIEEKGGIELPDIRRVVARRKHREIDEEEPELDDIASIQEGGSLCPPL